MSMSKNFKLEVGDKCRLAPADANFWLLDSPTTRQTIACYCHLEHAPDINAVIEDLGQCANHLPRLRCRVSHGGKLVWQEDPEFSIDNHISTVELPTEEDPRLLLKKASEEFSKPLDKAHPPWRVVIFSSSKPEVSAGLMFIIDHTVTDGLGGLEILRRISRTSHCTDSYSRTTPRPKTNLAPANNRQQLSTYSRFRSFFRLLREGIARPVPSPLNGENSPQRVISVVDFPLAQLTATRRRLGVSLNDLLLTIVTGAVRKHLEREGAAIADLRVIVPVNLRPRSERHSLGNHLTGIGVSLPTSIDSPLEQLKAISRHTSAFKTRGSFGAYAMLAKINSFLPKGMIFRISEFAAKRTNFICTNISGIKTQRFIGGARILSCYGLPALMRNHGIAFSFTSHHQKICAAVISDPNIVPDAEVFLDHLCQCEAEVRKF